MGEGGEPLLYSRPCLGIFQQERDEEARRVLGRGKESVSIPICKEGSTQLLGHEERPLSLPPSPQSS